MLALPRNHQFYQAFDHIIDYTDAGSDYAWVYIYDESGTYPLAEEGTGIEPISGSAGQEDWVAQSAITANHAVGKQGLRRSGLGCLLWWLHMAESEATPQRSWTCR